MAKIKLKTQDSEFTETIELQDDALSKRTISLTLTDPEIKSLEDAINTRLSMLQIAHRTADPALDNNYQAQIDALRLVLDSLKA